MSSTQFKDYSQNTPIVAAWLNDVNNDVYTAAGTAKVAKQSSAAWVRFSATGGTVVIQQSSNISTVIRTAMGVYVVTFQAPLINSHNCYSGQLGVPGFVAIPVESTSSVTLACTDNTNTPIDPASVSFTVFGDN